MPGTALSMGELTRQRLCFHRVYNVSEDNSGERNSF